jgi:hypothetical protein
VEQILSDKFGDVGVAVGLHEKDVNCVSGLGLRLESLEEVVVGGCVFDICEDEIFRGVAAVLAGVGIVAALVCGLVLFAKGVCALLACFGLRREWGL